MRIWNGSRHQKSLVGLFIYLAIIGALFLTAGAGPVRAQDASPTPTTEAYPGPLPASPTSTSPYPGPETATSAPTALPTLATTSTAGAPTLPPLASPDLSTPTEFIQPQAQSTQDLQGTPQTNGPAPTYVPFPEITFQLPEQDIAGPNDLSQEQASPTPAVSQGGGGIGRWVPLGVILVIWGLLAGWFYLSFRRMG